MITKKFSSLGHDVMLEVPASVEEFDKNANRVGACLDEGINNVIYRGSLADVRELFCEEIERETGIPRKTETRELASKDEAGNPKTAEVYTETEAVYYARVLRETGRPKADFQPTMDKVAASVKFDASVRERAAAGPRKANKDSLAYVAQLRVQGKIDALCASLTASLGREFNGGMDDTVLALGVQEHVKNQLAARAAAIKAELLGGV